MRRCPRPRTGSRPPRRTPVFPLSRAEDHRQPRPCIAAQKGLRLRPSHRAGRPSSRRATSGPAGRTVFLAELGLDGQAPPGARASCRLSWRRWPRAFAGGRGWPANAAEARLVPGPESQLRARWPTCCWPSERIRDNWLQPRRVGKPRREHTGSVPLPLPVRQPDWRTSRANTKHARRWRWPPRAGTTC